jgi:hypothetical protein
MGFDPCIRPLKIRKSIGTPTPKMGIHLGVWRLIPSYSFALLGAWDVTPWASLLARNLTSPYFGRKPKARVATHMLQLLWRLILFHDLQQILAQDFETTTWGASRWLVMQWGEVVIRVMWMRNHVTMRCTFPWLLNLSWNILGSMALINTSLSSSFPKLSFINCPSMVII